MNFKVEAIYFAEFDIRAGPQIRALAAKKNQSFVKQIRKNFEEWKEFIIPEEELCKKSLRIFLDDNFKNFSILSHAV